MPDGSCFCAEIPVVESRTRVVVVRHIREAWLASNTGHIVNRVLTNSHMVDHGVLGAPVDLTHVLGPDAWLLAPGAEPVVEPRVDTLVVLDGSWGQSFRMKRRIPPLPALPVLSLPPPRLPPLRMRRGADPTQLATIEAVAAALELLGDPEPALALRDVFRRMATIMRQLRGYDGVMVRRG